MQAELATADRRAGQLERQLALANGGGFYLILDPGAAELTLMLRAAELQRYPVLGLQVGRPRVAWIRRHDPDAWQGVTWSAGELDPPRQSDRLVVQAVEPEHAGDEPKAPPIPKTAEELYEVPSRYHVRFRGGLSIEIRPHEADGQRGRLARLAEWWSSAWRDRIAALASAKSDSVRVRVVLKPADAQSLYRSLPPATSLLVLSGSERTAAQGRVPSAHASAPAPMAGLGAFPPK